MSSSGRSLGQSTRVDGSTSNPTTASASFADLAEMSITITTRGGSVMLDFAGVFSHSTTGRVDAGFTTDGASEFGVISVSAPSGGILFEVALHSLVSGLAAGSHTFKVRWATSGATATASGTARTFRAVELPA